MLLLTLSEGSCRDAESSASIIWSTFTYYFLIQRQEIFRIQKNIRHCIVNSTFYFYTTFIMSNEDQKNLKELVDHVGIGQSSKSYDTLMELMNLTLQCLGGVRLLVVSTEKERIAAVAAGESRDSKLSKNADEAIREVFASAVKRMLHSIVLASPLDDLDPSRHLVESFPLSHRIGIPEWLAIHWAVLGDDLYSSVNKRPDCVLGPPNSSKKVDLNPIQNGSLLDCADRITAIISIVGAHPELAYELDKEGRSILHYAARLSSVPLLKCVMKFSGSPGGFGPNQANLNGAYPLHNAARFSRSLLVTEHVLDFDPYIVTLGNNDGTLPLHWAAAKNANLDIINCLMKAHPSAIRIADHEGYLPLHSAGQNLQLHIVKAINAADPSAISVLDFEGGVPIHHACCYNTNIDVLNFMDSLYKSGVTVAQKDGITPLHLAASQNSSAKVMAFLLTKYPQAAFAVDDDGWLPLHCLVTRHRDDMTASRIDCLRLLLAANPGAICGKRNDGHTPLQISIASGHRDVVMRLMLFALPLYDKVLLARLNWGSYRRIAILACLIQHRTFSLEDEHSRSPSTDSDGADTDPSDSICSHIMRKLTDGYVGTSGLSIKNSILQYIINFL